MNSHIHQFSMLLALATIASTGQAAITTEGDVIQNGSIIVADQSDGSLKITAPDTLFTNDAISIATSPNVTGLIKVDGASLSTEGYWFAVGEAGQGSLEIVNGGAVSSPSGNTTFTVGTNAAAVGSVRVAGSGSSLRLWEAEAVLGQQGTGYLQIEDGADVVFRHFTVGSGDLGGLTPAYGQTLIDGPDSELEVREEFLIGKQGIGEVRVSNGAILRSGTYFSAPATIGYVEFGSGNPTTSSGAVFVDGPGSHWSQQGSLAVGGGGTGNLNITSGGVVSSGVGIVGGTSQYNGTTSPNGTVVIDGAGSLWSVSNLRVGLDGTGQVLLSNGARLINSNSEYFANGSSGTPESTVLGSEEGSFGRLVVDGTTTQWADNSNELIIGASGIGELSIRNSASVSNGTVVLGQNSTGHGHVKVENAGTYWRVNRLSVGGFYGSGKLEVSSGATLQLSAFDGQLSVSPDGEVVIDGGTIRGPAGFGSPINNMGILRGNGEIYDRIEMRSGGSLRVGDGQQLMVAEEVQNYDGRIEVVGGALELRGGLTNEFSSTVVLDDATLRVDESSFAGPGFDNRGSVFVAGGANQVFGEITNTGQIILSGNSQTTFYDDVANLNSLNVSTGSVATFFGRVSGNGVGGGGTVFLEGQISPGFSPGTMEFGGDIALGDFSRLNIEVGQEAHDLLEIAGSASIDGDLVLSALSALDGDTTLEILAADSIVGAFDSVPEMGQDLGFGVVFGGITYNADSVEISLLQQSGDFNDDGTANGTDLDQWQANYATSSDAALADGDAQRDTDVDGSDFLTWQQAVPPANPPAASQAVPEPGALALVSAVAIAAMNFRRSTFL